MDQARAKMWTLDWTLVRMWDWTPVGGSRFSVSAGYVTSYLQRPDKPIIFECCVSVSLGVLHHQKLITVYCLVIFSALISLTKTGINMCVTPKNNRNPISSVVISESPTSATSEDIFRLLCPCSSQRLHCFQPLCLNSRVPKTTGIWLSATEAL